MKNLEMKIHGNTYPVVIEKKKNKNTYIRVNQNFEIYITTSYFATDRSIMKLLKENEVIEEIARISSGEINEVTLQYAYELRNKKAS